MQLNELANQNKILVLFLELTKQRRNKDITEMSSSQSAQWENQLFLSSQRIRLAKVKNYWKKLFSKS